MFEGIIGNDNIKQELINSVNLNKCSHSYLFCGTDGIGKKLIAREFAKMILCESEKKYCNKCKSCLEFDSNNNRGRFVGEYPDVYAHNNMGTLNYWVPDLCREKNDGEVLVGFKASSEMLVYSPTTGESRFESVKSVYADTIPLPLTEKGRDYFIESDSYYYYAQYSHYGPISYDPWKKIYYRFVGIGLNDWELEPSPQLQNRKKWSVMVFDASFRKLGEQYLGDAYRVLAHFVSPDGLYLLNKGKEKGVAEYTLFTYNKE